MRIIVRPEIDGREDLRGGELADCYRLDDPLAGQVEVGVFDAGQPQGRSQVDRLDVADQDRRRIGRQRQNRRLRRGRLGRLRPGLNGRERYR